MPVDEARRFMIDCFTKANVPKENAEGKETFLNFQSTLIKYFYISSS